MRKATLTRFEFSNAGTFGRVFTDGYTCLSGELPVRENRTSESCIPAGVYLCTWRKSVKQHGMCYHLENVPGRSDILIHSANWMGDLRMGYRSQLEGCIALGLALGYLNGQRAILQSKSAIAEFADQMKKESFELTIV